MNHGLASGFVRKSDKGELSTCRRGRLRGHMSATLQIHFTFVFGRILWKWMNGVESTDSNQECQIGYKNFTNGVSQCLAYTRKLGNRRSSEGLRSFKPSNGTNLITLLILAGDIEMNPGPRVLMPPLQKTIARHRIRSSNARTVKSAFTHHAPNLETMNC